MKITVVENNEVNDMVQKRTVEVEFDEYMGCDAVPKLVTELLKAIQEE